VDRLDWSPGCTGTCVGGATYRPAEGGTGEDPLSLSRSFCALDFARGTLAHTRRASELRKNSETRLTDLDWHVLLGPLPPGAVPARQPVASPEVLASPGGSVLAGWEQLALHLSAGSAGSRSSLVVLDGSGTLLSGSDNVLYRVGLDGGAPPQDHDAPCLIRQESVGGRFEADGSFRGTRWLTEAEDPGAVDELEWKATKSEPSEADVAGLRTLVAELIRRAPGGYS
jgi:hypothetical protein